MAKIAKSRRPAVEDMYVHIYRNIYGQEPPKNSPARKMIRAGHDNVFAYRAERRHKR